jgi:PPM family protein phosphatase
VRGVFVVSLFRKLFKSKSNQKKHELDTLPVKYPEQMPYPDQTQAISEGSSGSSQLISASELSIGKQRDHNEDALFTLTTHLMSDQRQVPFGLYIIADGMGGHLNGEVASGLAVRVMANHVISKVYLPLLSLTPASPEESLQEIMGEGVQKAHETIRDQVEGGGTTLTAILVVSDQITIAHVGDSRAYAISQNGEMEVLTRDHSLVKRLEELGQITEDEAAVHPQRNVLYRALGQGEPFEPDIISTSLPKPGYLVLCSDGLWGVVPGDDLLHIIKTSTSIHQACVKLINAANQAGGPDNISVIVVHIPE